MLVGLALVRYLARGNREKASRSTQERLLVEHLARDEISDEEYHQRREALRDGSPISHRGLRSTASGSDFTPAMAYSALTPVYDVTLEVLGFGRSFKAAVAQLADVTPGEALLDLGCGTGTLLQALIARQPAATFTGIDPDPQVLSVARRRLAHSPRPVELVEGYAQDLPFPDESFDVVISTLIFHHMPDPVKVSALHEVRRVVSSKGRFLLVNFGAPPSLLARPLLAIGSFFDGRENIRANLAGELPGMLTAAGFQVHEVSRPHRGVRHLLAHPVVPPNQ